MQDQEIQCIGVDRENPCPNGATFTHTVKDQEFYNRMGFEAPKRCLECRATKKAMKPSNGHQTPRYERHNERRDNRNGRDRRGWGRDRDMFGE